MTVVLVMWTL